MEHQTTPLQAPPTHEAQRFSAIYQFYYQPLLLLGFLVCSWWTSNAGVLAMADWISGASETTRQIALLVTASAMGAQYALWHYAMRLIPRYATYQARGIGVVVVAVLMVMLALSSTYTSFIGISQDSARGLELQRQADEYAAQARTLAPRAAAMEDALFVIAPQAENADRTRGLRAASSTMAGSVAELETAGNGLAQAQARAIAAIVQEERASGAAIAAMIAEIEALPLPDAGRATLKPAQVLVLEHWRLHLPQLAIALAIDLFAPLSTLLFWAAAIKARARKVTLQAGEFQ
ncbi:hypothetical protein [Actibacterium sp. D379-3]